MDDNFSLGYALGQDGNGGNNGMFGNSEGWWVIILFALIFGWGGRGGYGFGGCGNGGGGATDGYVLASDMARIQNTISSGLCDGFYAMNTGMLNGFSGLQSTAMQGFAGLNTAIVQQGYENRIGQNDIASQLATCCCTTQQNIKDSITQGVMNTNAIQQQIQQCCCDNEKTTLQNRYEAAQMNCNTLQAIDKLGDRIIDYMNADKAQALRDENQALRLAASQSAQNQYLINQLRPAPIPAFPVPSPFYYSGCGNNSCC